MADRVSTDDVIAFRLRAHHLDRRAGGDELLEAAGRCAVQNSPPGSALLALHARVQDVTTDRLEHAVAQDRSLLQTWCMRGAPFFFPTVDAPVFTTGVLPPSEEAQRRLILGVEPALDELEMSLHAVLELVRAEVETVLTGHRLDINELGAQAAPRIASRLSRSRRATWEREGPHAKGQPLGEAVVHFCVRLLTLQGIVCFAPRTGNTAPFVLVSEWLDHPIDTDDVEGARRELLRRYLRCYGPSTPGGFASWLGVRAKDIDPWWSLLQDELARVEFGGTSWLLAEDLEVWGEPTMPQGVRLLPPRDPYTQLRDRATIVDPVHHRDLWRTVGEPGTVLVDGRIGGTWRPRKSGPRLSITVTPFGGLRSRDKKDLEGEAEQIAHLRGASSVDMVVDDD